MMTESETTEMARDEKTLLLFLETRAVDHAGRVDIRHMNYDDMNLAQTWALEGFVEFGRIESQHHSKYGTHYVHLSEAAMEAAHKERRARAERQWARRRYQTIQRNREA